MQHRRGPHPSRAGAPRRPGRSSRGERTVGVRPGEPRAAPQALDARSVALAIARAIERRAASLEDSNTDALRLVHDFADGLPGFVVEKLGPVLVAQYHEGRAARPIEDYRAALAPHLPRLGATSAYLKVFPRDRSAALPRLEAALRDPRPWIGEPAPPEHVVREDGVRFVVRAYDGFATGLFLDHRTHRRIVRRIAAGRRVLNGFAYTCGLSLVAALGGAAGVSSVDVSKRCLEWGKRNFAENGVALDRARLFYCCDMLEFYKRAARKHERFDLVILDPPAFARLKESRRVFLLERDLAPLVEGALALLDPGGLLLIATNLRGLPIARLEEAVRRAAAPRRAHLVERPAPPIGFEGDPEFMKSLLLRLD